jgi:hypothetical protein
MFPRTVRLHPVYHRLLARGLAAVALVGIAPVHLMQLPHTWEESPALGAMFAVLVVAATVASGAIGAAVDEVMRPAARTSSNGHPGRTGLDRLPGQLRMR